MKRNFVACALAVVGISAFLGGCSSSSDSGSTADTGESLFASNCSACHGPKGGGAIGPNITGSTTAGVGEWTDEQFATAVRTGVDDEGRSLCSQMTRFSQSALSDEKLNRIHEYLLSQSNDTPNEGTGCK